MVFRFREHLMTVKKLYFQGARFRYAGRGNIAKNQTEDRSGAGGASSTHPVDIFPPESDNTNAPSILISASCPSAVRQKRVRESSTATRVTQKPSIGRARGFAMW